MNAFYMFDNKSKKFLFEKISPKINKNDDINKINRELMENLKSIDKMKNNDILEINLNQLKKANLLGIKNNKIAIAITSNKYKQRIANTFLNEAIILYEKKDFSELEKKLIKFNNPLMVDKASFLIEETNNAILDAKNAYMNNIKFQTELIEVDELAIRLENDAEQFKENTNKVNSEMKKKNRRLLNIIIYSTIIFIIVLVLIMYFGSKI